MEDYGRINSGRTIEKMKTEIRHIFTGITNISHVYGFGSFFRGEMYRDIDLLVVISGPREELLMSFRAALKAASAVAKIANVRVDLTALTPSEFAAAPLRDMDELQLISGQDI